VCQEKKYTIYRNLILGDLVAEFRGQDQALNGLKCHGFLLGWEVVLRVCLTRKKEGTREEEKPHHGFR
jgi:hypothetical protein